ncbi:MAG: hypothetical protein AVDCRST_MAG49-3500 [uncultured Thermomicrobiales bacterium]|uniref:Uncharacterized protein n=1 Tax=uncultured Thermomicrobiales bacterium TaxID=1645740 RepID=A0A6J4V986_9BACT|nr:MAG: hypothetical protein AVDCRST_MAG49-3500 [uncultured Thermomicrobiales bacterium]
MPRQGRARRGRRPRQHSTPEVGDPTLAAMAIAAVSKGAGRARRGATR